MHIYTHTYIHTYSYIHTHTYALTYIHTYTHTYTIHIYTYIHTSHTYTRMYVHKYIHTYITGSRRINIIFRVYSPNSCIIRLTFLLLLCVLQFWTLWTDSLRITTSLKIVREPYNVFSFNYRNTSSRVLLVKMAVTQLVRKFLAFYGTHRFIAVFTRAQHWFLWVS